MRDPRRIGPVLEVIRIVWQANPDMRLMQLLLNLEDGHSDLWYLEDDQLIERLVGLYLGEIVDTPFTP